MEHVRVLDCTLRDGGYCNNWEFGWKNIRKIIQKLVDAKLDIVECGFLTNKVEYDREKTQFTELGQIQDVIGNKAPDCTYVAMINYGEYDVENLKQYDGKSVDGIRIAFHKKDIDGALDCCRKIKQKGYKVFVQPMVTLNYSDEEFISLIKQCNDLTPYAFYIVDSFGVMKEHDLTRLYYLVEHNLKKEVYIGYHSHNNMQLAYSNAQKLVNINGTRKLIIDTSVMGMGRGAGNLNTELFLEYLNNCFVDRYKISPLLTLIDEIIDGFYQKKYWGYSLPNYLSAKHNAHPNYAIYLNEKQTLTVEAMDQIFSIMSEEKRVYYDEQYIGELYTMYMTKGGVNEARLQNLRDALNGKRVLVIAPGKSVAEEENKILKYSEKEDIVTISVNFKCPYVCEDYIFVSNMRRYQELPPNSLQHTIVTSNIDTEDVFLKISYPSLFNSIEAVKENAGMMMLEFLMQLGIKDVLVAGMDGYSYDVESNYAQKNLQMNVNKEQIRKWNTGMEQAIKKFQETMKIKSVTKEKYIHI